MIILEYELTCGCGAVKTESTRRNIIEWLLNHRSQKPQEEHKSRILWRYNNRVRTLTDEEIDDFIEYIQSGKMEENDRKYPFGHPGLGGGPNMPYRNRTGIPR
jgi:hypothetical protein